MLRMKKKNRNNKKTLLTTCAVFAHQRPVLYVLKLTLYLYLIIYSIVQYRRERIS